MTGESFAAALLGEAKEKDLLSARGEVVQVRGGDARGRRAGGERSLVVVVDDVLMLLLQLGELAGGVHCA